MEQKQQENQIKFSTQKSNYTLEITPELEQTFRYLCNKFPQREWSGILFYDYSGSFANNDIKFIAKGFYFMDEGDATSTEFDLDNPDVVGYMCDNDLFGLQSGLVHSHNQMAAFFSGQDDSMLKQEGAKRNHFLSLVVNNAGKYVARVTCKETYKYIISGKSTFKTFNDVLEEKELAGEREQFVVMAYDLNIVMPEATTYDELDKRIEECKRIKEEKERKKKEEKKEYSLLQPQSYTPYTPISSIYPPKNFYEIKTKLPEIEIPDISGVLSKEEYSKIAAQIITLNYFADVPQAIEFLPKMKTAIESRFETIDDYLSVLHLMIDEIVDYELGEVLLSEIKENENIDSILDEAKMQIAEFVEELAKDIKDNDYIELITNYLYA